MITMLNMPTQQETVATFPAQPVPKADEERNAFIRLSPADFTIRHPPPPFELSTYITPDSQLFQTIHMGAAVIDHSLYKIVIDGLVSRPFSITLDELKRMPQTSITGFHECYGSPLKPPTEALWRVGNVQWTGVRLSYLLDLAGLPASTEGLFVWSEGLDRGTFAGVEADRYQKDLPMAKAMAPEVLVAYEMNGEPLSKERGGPARLVVPGWFGTNSTKWLCRLSVQAERAPGPYTTTFYNERDLNDEDEEKTRPVWKVEINSMIVRPRPGERIEGLQISVEGWAWSDDGVKDVKVSPDGGITWQEASVEKRFQYGWQHFEMLLNLQFGQPSIVARATSISGHKQPLIGHRNHAHQVEVVVKKT
jgi:DMSO/TMAO reductase YedYZ molybdopterin-dependent catalytic subunit